MLADVHTPVGIYNKLRDRFTDKILLESADYHDRSDSKSFICLEQLAQFEAKENEYQYNLPGESTVKKQVNKQRDVFDAFRLFTAQFESTENGLPFQTQGLFGYSSFESVAYVEDISLQKNRKTAKDNPDLKYQLFRFILVFDHFKNELYIIQNSVNHSIASNNEMEQIRQSIQVNNLPNFPFAILDDETSNVTDEAFKNMVKKGIEHCKRGDTFQLVLSREFRRKFKGDDFNLYRCLRSINPSPYLFYFDYGDFKIFGSSPESQLKIDNGMACINPIAGTVLRGENQEDDEKLAEQLRKHPKEMSEHVMLVDLARNDLSKNSDKVEIDAYAEIQYFSHVIHMVSRVKGKLSKSANALDIYADTFPAGTLSGAPKYRALELISKYENTSRNFYGGSIGFIGFDGSLNQAIIIRSALSKNNTLIYQAGAGIVANSTPEGELHEVNNKVAAIRTAIQKASELCEY